MKININKYIFLISILFLLCVNHQVFFSKSQNATILQISTVDNGTGACIRQACYRDEW